MMADKQRDKIDWNGAVGGIIVALAVIVLILWAVDWGQMHACKQYETAYPKWEFRHAFLGCQVKIRGEWMPTKAFDLALPELPRGEEQ